MAKKKIPQDLPQFEDTTAVLVVTGSQEAEFYKVQNGEIEKLEDFQIEKPTYSDKEGWFQRSGLGRFFGSGGTEKDIKKEVQTKFLAELEKQIKNMINDVDLDQTFLFTPQYMHKTVEGIVNKSKLKNVSKTFPGNYYKQSGLDLLKKIKQRLDTKKQSAGQSTISEEAKKILDRKDK